MRKLINNPLSPLVVLLLLLAGVVGVRAEGDVSGGSVGGASACAGLSDAGPLCSLAAVTLHYLMVGNGTSTPTLLAPGTTGLPLVSQGASADPAYAALLPAALDFSADNTTQNATLGHHGLLPKLSGTATDVLHGDGSYSGVANISGNAATATALAANGTNCSAGHYPLGVDASGNVESCTAAPTTASPVFTGVVGFGGSTSSYGGIYANATTSGQTWITDATGAVNTLKVGTVDFQSGSFSSNAPSVRIDARVKVLQGQGVDFYSGSDIQSGSVVAMVRAGSGSPEGVLTAPIGSLYLRTNGGAGTTLYIKESGSGNTGWVGK